MDTVRVRRKRTRGAKKQGAVDVATEFTSDSVFQRAGLGHGPEQPNLPGTHPTGASTGVSGSKREKVDREVERCCQCTRHSTCCRTCACKERGTVCTNCMCFSQCCNKVTGKPSPATAGSRDTLHRFFETPEKTTKQVKISDSYQQKREIGETIMIAPSVDRIEQDGPGVPEDLEFGATAFIASKQSDFAILAELKDIYREEKESAPEEGGKGDAITIALPFDNGDEAKAVARGDNEVGAKAATSEKQSGFAIFAKRRRG